MTDDMNVPSQPARLSDIVDRLAYMMWFLPPDGDTAEDHALAADAHAEIIRLRNLLDAIAALHQPISNPYDNEPDSLCGHDMYKWPCPTARLLHQNPEENPT